MLENLSKYQIILASQSPRRRELLAGLDIDFTVKVLPGLNETYPEPLMGANIPVFLAKQKAEAYLSVMKENTLLITADTIVWCNNKMYGKPVDRADAKAMLRVLSDNMHTVFTGVCLQSVQKQVVFSVATDVLFAKLSDEEIDYYIDKYHPMDKAGSYGVQEWIGYVAVKQINGSFYNVMGLPVQRLYAELKRW